MLSPARIFNRLTGKGSSSSSSVTMRCPDFLDHLIQARSCPLLSIVDEKWEFSSSYKSRMLLAPNHSLTIPLSTKGIPTPNSYRTPSYVINIDGRQVYKGLPETRLVVCPFCEVWLEDQQNSLCRVVVGKLLGKDGELFIFGCHGCPGYAHHARHHSDCSYGVLRVHPEYVHPSLRARMHQQIDTRCLSGLGTLLCELAYPLGYIDTLSPLLSYEYFFTPHFETPPTATSDPDSIGSAHSSDDSDGEGSDADDERTLSPPSCGGRTPAASLRRA